MTEQESIIQKAVKFMRMAERGSEAEAAFAASKLQEMLARYNLDVSTVQAAELADQRGGKTDASGKPTKEEVKHVVRPRHRRIRAAVAEMNFCRYYYYPARGGQKEEINVFVGAPHNIEVTKLFSQWLIETTWSLAKRAAKENRVPSREQNAYRHTFANECSVRLAERIRKLIRERSRQPTQMSDGRNLPALANLYQQTAEANQEYMISLGIITRTVKSRMRGSSWSGAQDGRRAADGINLNTQVHGRSSNKLLR